MHLRLVLAFALAFTAGAVRPASHQPQATSHPPKAIWVYLATNLLVDANVDSGLAMLTKASNLGYNGVMVSDSKFCRWGEYDGRYEANCRTSCSMFAGRWSKLTVSDLPIGRCLHYGFASSVGAARLPATSLSPDLK